MKARDSEMSDEDTWQTIYDADCIINKLDCAKKQNDVIAEIGCRYGTYTSVAFVFDESVPAGTHAAASVLQCLPQPEVDYHCTLTGNVSADSCTASPSP